MGTPAFRRPGYPWFRRLPRLQCYAPASRPLVSLVLFTFHWRDRRSQLSLMLKKNQFFFLLTVTIFFPIVYIYESAHNTLHCKTPYFFGHRLFLREPVPSFFYKIHYFYSIFIHFFTNSDHGIFQTLKSQSIPFRFLRFFYKIFSKLLFD